MHVKCSSPQIWCFPGNMIHTHKVYGIATLNSDHLCGRFQRWPEMGMAKGQKWTLFKPQVEYPTATNTSISQTFIYVHPSSQTFGTRFIWSLNCARPHLVSSSHATMMVAERFTPSTQWTKTLELGSSKAAWRREATGTGHKKIMKMYIWYQIASYCKLYLFNYTCT